MRRATIAVVLAASACGGGGTGEETARTTLPVSHEEDKRACEVLELELVEERQIILAIQEQQGASPDQLQDLQAGYSAAIREAISIADEGPVAELLSQMRVHLRDFEALTSSEWSSSGLSEEMFSGVETIGPEIQTACSGAGVAVVIHPYLSEQPTTTSTTIPPTTTTIPSGSTLSAEGRKAALDCVAGQVYALQQIATGEPAGPVVKAGRDLVCDELKAAVDAEAPYGQPSPARALVSAIAAQELDIAFWELAIGLGSELTIGVSTGDTFDGALATWPGKIQAMVDSLAS